MPNDMNKKRPVVLCILDGWGYRAEKDYNAVEMADSPNWHRMYDTCPHTFIHTSGLEVGLPEGQMGNSEVGHTNIGAGRVVMQELPKISLSLQDGSFASLPAIEGLKESLQKSKGDCHLLGLLSPGGVHSHQEHILGVAKLLASYGIKVWVHALLDGRDVPPNSALDYVKYFEEQIKTEPNIAIATVGGRYYGMDRDKRWDRIKLAYDALVFAKGERYSSAEELVKASYDKEIFDEFVVPAVVGDYQGMKDGDGFFMINFRLDRSRQICTALLDDNFAEFDRGEKIKFCDAVGMTEYSAELAKIMHIAFPPESLENVFGKVVADAGLKQLRIAETEKYAHVTFYFNGGRETVYEGEDRILVPSPKVATYDLKPEMSAYEVADKLEEAILSEKYDVIILNFANGDMVGHTGVMDAAVKAVEAVDKCLLKIENAIKKVGGEMLIIADHGNCELMFDENTGTSYTAHTTFDVPAILVNASADIKGLADGGRLADIAPTLLELLGIDKPKEMTGHSLLVKD